MVKIKENGYTTLLNLEEIILLGSKSFEISTLAYVTTPSYIKKASNIWSGKVKSIVFPYERALDIDDKFDYEMACRFGMKNTINYE